MIAVQPRELHASRTAACRACESPLQAVFADLGASAVSNYYPSVDDLHGPLTTYPLKAFVCEACLLVQLEAFHAPEAIFRDYVYFSSYSESWLAHGRAYTQDIVAREALGANHMVVEIASNDGYLLKHFVDRGIPVLGIEPAQNVAAVAAAAGIRTIAEFFGVRLATELRAQGIRPDVLIANNVLAHVPDLHDFVGGIAVMLDRHAICTIEFPHLLTLVAGCEFDTIYHEHFSYFSVLALRPVFARHGLEIVDIELLPTHGGSLRLTVAPSGARAASDRVSEVVGLELAAGFDRLETYERFAASILRVKYDTLMFLLAAQREGKRVAAYGAPAKGNTFLTYCGIRRDLIAYTVDRNPHKQGRFLPGSMIPVYGPHAIVNDRPDYVFILAWNVAGEIMEQMDVVRSWGGRFVTAIPALTIHP